jgi:hypothetical protein
LCVVFGLDRGEALLELLEVADVGHPVPAGVAGGDAQHLVVDPLVVLHPEERDRLQDALAHVLVPDRDGERQVTPSRFRNGESELGDLVTRRHAAFDRIGGYGAREHHDVDRHHPTPPFAPDRSIARRHAT